MGFDAADADFSGVAVSSMKDFVAALRALPPDIEHIYLNALALPSTVSNLMPLPDYAEYYKPPAGQYYAEYENRFGFSYGRLTGAEVAVLDQRVAAFNDLVEHEAAADGRIHVVRLDELLKDYDSKHRAEALSVVTADGKTLSNVMTEGAPWPFPKFRCGGLQGLDGMHPTVVGYTLMARKVLEAIKQHEGLTAPLPNLDAAYQADSLLQDVPRQWETVLWAWRDIRRARAFADPAPVGPHEDATKALMQAVQFKTS
jgi:lysophospholipase L1-like esterase